MIKTFRDSETEKIWRREYSKRLPPYIQERALMKLQQLNAAGDLKGEYSIRVNKQWRVCFRWQDGHAWNVGITDYH